MVAEQKEENKSLIILFPQAGTGGSYLQKVKELLQPDTSVQIFEAKTSKEVSEQVQKFNRALVIFCIADKSDLSVVLNALGDWNTLIRGKFLRAIGVCQMNHPQIPPTLMKRGCADLFSATLNQKALKHKISQSLKILETYYTQMGGMKPPVASADANAKPEAQGAPAKKKAEEKPQLSIKKLPPLKLASDCWLVRKDRDLRQVQGRWIVDLIGPGPSAGIWDENKKLGGWEWKPKNTVESKDFITDEGIWLYRGRKPEFVWDMGRWRFLGENPELVFVKGEETLATRFKLVEKALEYADNSPQARARLPAIIKSIENEVRFKTEQKSKVEEKELKDKKAAPAEKPAEEITKPEDEKKPSTGFDFEDTGDAKGGVSEPNVHDLTKDKDPEYSDGFALRGEVDENPFNQAPAPKLKIWVAPAQTGAGKPVEANPLEFGEKEFILGLPSGLFAPEQGLILVLDDGLLKANSRQRVRATLKQIIGTEGEMDTVSIMVDPAMKISLAPIQQAFEKRQEEILNFLKAARGW